MDDTPTPLDLKRDLLAAIGDLEDYDVAVAEVASVCFSYQIDPMVVLCRYIAELEEAEGQSLGLDITLSVVQRKLDNLIRASLA